jgi:serpin B
MRARALGALALSLGLGLAGVLGGSVASSGAAQASGAGAAAATAENGFALNLLRLVGGSGNVVYSPYSVDAALTMAAAGANGPTAAQIDKVLGASSKATATANAATLGHAIGVAAPSGVSGAPTLELANALWIEQGVPLQAPFVTTLSHTFGAPPQDTNFSGAPDAARQTINAWVSRHTASLIQDLLPQGSVSAATVFVLANAIYLKANWATPFATRLTHDAPFTTATGQRISVPFMSAPDAAYSYASSPHYQAVEVPYRSSSLSLLAILPTGESLTALQPSLNAATLSSLVTALRNRQVNLLMPKLHLHTQTSLNGPLQALGMTDAFGSAANFSAITTKVPLQISLVEHAADLKIDEQGTVAAAATGIVGPTAIALPTGPPVTVNLDHPYLLLLRDDGSGAILFVARVADPSTS